MLIERRINECKHSSANKYIVRFFDFSNVLGIYVAPSYVHLDVGLSNNDDFIDRNGKLDGFYNSFDGDLLDDFYLNDDLLTGDYKFKSHAVVESCSGKRTLMPFWGG